MEKEYQMFAEEVANVVAKVAINKLRSKGIEVVDYECYISYNYEDAILNDIAIEVKITGDNPIKLSLFSFVKYTPDGETIGVIFGERLLKLTEITEYKFPIDIQKMMIEFVLFDLTYTENRDKVKVKCNCEMPAKMHGKNICWRCKRSLS